VKFVRISLTVAAVLVAAVVGILALSGGLRLTSPVGEMRAEALGLELTGAEEMTSLEEVEDRVCFLQCSARSVRFTVRSPRGSSAESDCRSLQRRLEAWANEQVTQISTKETSRTACLLSIEPEPFGHQDWRVVAGFDAVDSADNSTSFEWDVSLTKSDEGGG
jgi:hypothetical protein